MLFDHISVVRWGCFVLMHCGPHIVPSPRAILLDYGLSITTNCVIIGRPLAQCGSILPIHLLLYTSITLGPAPPPTRSDVISCYAIFVGEQSCLEQD